jgi:hypothetical protein
MAMASRLNSDSSMPGRPWVTPSHMAGHAAGDLGRAADLARRLADHVGEALERLVGREHVVIGGDDADIGRSTRPSRVSLSAMVWPAKAWAQLAQDSLARPAPESRAASMRRI